MASTHPRRRRRHLLLACAGLAGVLVIAACSSSGGSTSGSGTAAVPSTVKIGRATTLTYVVVDLANALGYYKQAGQELGTNIQIVTFGGEGASVAALVGGQTQFGIQQSTSAVSADLQGQHLEVVQELANGGVGEVLGNKSITNPKDFEGKTVAFTSLASVGYPELQAALKHDGVDISKVKFVSVGNEAAMIAAFKNGTVQAVGPGEPIASQIKSEGGIGYTYDFYNRSTMESILGGPIITTTFMTTQSYAAKYPRVVQALVDANLKTIQYMYKMQNNPMAVLAKLPSSFAQYKPLWPSIYKNLMASLSPNGEIDPAAFTQVIGLAKVIGLVKPGQNVDVSTLYTNKFTNQ